VSERIDKFKDHIRAQVMKEQLEKVKEHIKRNKVAYSCLATGLITAGFTCVIVRGRASSQRIGRGTSVTANRGISVVADRSVVTSTVSFISSRRQGAPGWVVRCNETGDVFSSQLKAANAMNIPASEISKQLNGLMKNVRGYTFERICLTG
jgi:hypothetical protein